MCKDGREKMTVVLDVEILDLLTEYAYFSKLRSKNTAASEIVTDFIKQWVEAGKPI